MAERAWDLMREYALGMPHAIEDFPWNDIVIKIDYPRRRWPNGLVVGPMFVWLSAPDAASPTVSVKLRGAYDQAVAVGGATPTTMSGLGKWGWLTVPLADADLDLVRDWIDESYRVVAPKRLLAKLDDRRSAGGPTETADPRDRPRRSR